MKTDSNVVAVEARTDSGFEFSYRLEVSEIEYEEGIFPSYSISASVENRSTGYADRITVRELTSVESVAMDFLTLISNGCVTPMTLLEVAEDFLAEA